MTPSTTNMHTMAAHLTDWNGIISTITGSPAKSSTVALIAAAIGYFVVKRLQHTSSGRIRSDPYPPGPPREFLIGALRSFPKSGFLEKFCEWARIYGDIVYAPLPGTEIVILNSYEVAHELLAKRPSSTAGRNFGYLASELMGLDWQLNVKQPGPSHSEQRKMLRRTIGPQNVGRHDATIESMARKILNGLNKFQGCPTSVIHLALDEMVSIATYGDQIWKEMGADLVRWNKANISLMDESVLSFWFVNIFHFLRYTPDWIPGLRFKELIRQGHDLSEKIRFRPFNQGVGLYKSGVLGHSILHDLLEEFGEVDDVRDALAVLYIAASDTTTAAIIQFLHSLFIFPDVAERVFQEIQSVTQGHRLPKISDRPNLPFTDAVWKEAARWSPFIPISVPHLCTRDEVIKGYLIPKGTIIHQNIKMMLHDPKVWGDPEVFRPERFLGPSGSQLPSPVMVHFGWGMRQCPGMYLADRVVFHLVAMVISLYKMEPLDGSTLPDPKSVKYTPTGIQHPVGFECRFTVRDEKAQHLLKTISLSE